MISKVQQLAEKSCPECRGLCPTCTPGLKVNEDSDCVTCLGTGALVPELRRECRSYWEGQHHRDSCEGCKRGWVLIPEGEQRQAMEDWAVEYKYQIRMDRDGIQLLELQGVGCWIGTGRNMTAKIAHAILQARGLSNGATL